MRWTSTPFYLRFYSGWLLVLALCFTSGHARAQAVPAGQGQVADTTELRVLRQFYAATGGDQWYTRTNWLQGTTLAAAASWYGVTVANGDVANLSFYSNNLRGALPTGLSKLTQLQRLTCTSNQLSGPLPASLGQLPRLQYLSLGFNQFTGPLPTGFAQLINLDLSNNQFSGAVPAVLGQLAYLQYLDLSGNRFGGALPTGFAALRSLNLSFNAFSGAVPTGLGQFTQLEDLRLAHNGLNGALPVGDLAQLPHLSNLDLSDNQFYGPLPAGLNQLAHLASLNLSNNSFYNGVPFSDLAQLTTLRHLFLGGNRLSGALPAALGQLPQLWTLDLSRNQFSGALPLELGQLTQLQYLYLSNNQFSGLLPTALGQLAQLYALDVSGNQLGGAVPASLAQLAKLYTLSLANNQFTQLPNMRSVARPGGLQLFAVSNRLTFGSLEANFTGPGQQPYYSFSYVPQLAPAGRADTVRFAPGQGLVLRRPLGGAHTRYQWQRRVAGAWQDVAGARDSVWTRPAASAADSGAYRVTATNDWAIGLTLTSRPVYARATAPDPGPPLTNPPTGATACVDLLDAAPPRVDVAPAVNFVRTFVPRVALTDLGLGTAAPTPTTGGTAPGTGPTPTGSIGRAQWNNFYSASVADIPVGTAPDRRDVLTAFEAGSDLGDNYGARVRGYLVPPATGDYTFWLASDDDATLWLSPDENPAGKVPVATVVGYTDLREWDKFPDQRSAPVHLVAGRRYYVEALHREGTGGDHLAVAWALPDGTVTRAQGPIAGPYLAPVAGDGADPAPAPTGTVSFERWDGVAGTDVADIPVTTPPTSTGTLSALEAPVDAGDTYGLRLRGYLTAPQTGNYTFWLASDDQGEFWLSSDEDPGHKVRVAYTENWTGPRQWDRYPGQQSAPVALVAGQRYYLEALLKEDAGGDHLTVRWQLPDGTEEVPLAGAHLSPYTPPAGAAALTGTGTVSFERWDGVAGVAVADIPVAAPPTSTGMLSALEAPVDAGDAYGLRVRGYLTAPLTGDYTFWLASDDQGELWMSADENPAGKVRVAYTENWTGPRQWDRYPGQQSALVHLVAGQRYYLEALLKEDAGGDHLTVRWRMPDGREEVPLAGAHLSPFGSPAPAATGPVANGGFEAAGAGNALAGWQTAYGAGSPTDAAYRDNFPAAHAGGFHATHYQNRPYEADTYQVVSGLPNGLYTLRAWVQTVGGQDAAFVQAQSYGGPLVQTAISATPGGVGGPWVLVEVPNIAVTAGQCRVGVYSRGPGGAALYFDDVALVAQAAAAAVAVANPGFEADGAPTQTPQGWATAPGAGTDGQADYTEAFPGPHGGAYHGTHYQPQAYEVYTYQTVTGLAPGAYALRAWLRSNDGNSKSVLRAQNYGGPRREAGLPLGTSADAWVQVELAGLAVTNGQLEVGFYSRADAGQSFYFDDVELVRQAEATAALSKEQVAVTTQYLDGLGRPVQTVQHQASPQGHDVVTPMSYDALGRQAQDFLPYAAASRSAPTAFSYQADARRDQYDFYRDPQTAGPELRTEGVARTGVAYGEKQFEPSPLNRVLQQGAPGEAWALGGGHEAHRTERPNTAADAVPRYAAAYRTTAADAHALAYQGSYPAGALWVTETTDEQQNATQDFKDKQGQVVAKKVGLGAGQWLTTGYVYDDLDRLRTVLPPKATRLLAGNGQQVTAAVDSLLFYYRYDGRGRQIAKQVPGQAGEVLTVYDQLDRPILTQDPAQRARQEWAWTKYDALGRVVLIGLVARNATAAALQQEADQLATAEDGQVAAVAQWEQPVTNEATQYYSVTGAYPRLGQDGFGAGRVLAAAYYDDYNFDHDAAGTPDLAFNDQYTAQFPAGHAPAADARATGLTTRTRTRVLGVAENDPTQAAWLTTTTFYDAKARPVQVVATTARRDGQDVVTSQVDFTGQVLKTYAVHTDPRHDPVGVGEWHAYDHGGRLLATRQQLPDEAAAALLDSLEYNEVGQLLRKRLAPGTGLAQTVDYAYNPRGWLTGLNEDLVTGTTPAAKSKDLWGLQLSYDCGFQVPQFNGNVAGQKWRNQRDGVARAYGYGYDGANRLLFGDFVAQGAAGAWNAEQQRYALAGVRYDENGNILALQRRGLLANATRTAAKQFGPVDKLSYAYAGNRLQAVNDQVTTNQLARPAGYYGAPTSLAGDFQEAGVRQAQEYTYDPNGSLLQDRNKGITGILYNHLSLPRQVRFGTGADSVVFRYTAAGQKVAKLVYQTGKKLVRTDYLGAYQYEGDSLRFFPHAEGRVLRFVSKDPAGQATVRYEREYTLKDHLGNLRLAYRLGHRQTFTATLEQDEATRKREVHQFDSLSVSPPVAQAVGAGLARTGTYAARLNAEGTNRQPIGPLKQLAVQKGDSITVTAPGYYPQPVQNSNFNFSLAAFVASLVQQQSAPAPGADGQRRRALPLLSIGVSAALLALNKLSGGVPQGYVRLLVFDADSNLVSAQTVTKQLSAAAASGYEPLQVGVRLAQDGYVTAYVGNESPTNVYFDDVQVVLEQGLQVQETEYDPAGLELAGMVRPSPGIQGLNNYRFNGKEFQADLGLNWNHQDWRFLDPQLLRWHAVDPEVENGQESWTPYSFGYDNAVRYADANGRCPCEGGPSLSSRVAAYALGVGVAVVDNALGVNFREHMNLAPSLARDYNGGQDDGDRYSVGLGAGEAASGEVLEVGGAVLAPESAGLTLAGSAVGVGLVAHGAIFAGRGAQSLASQKGRMTVTDENGRVNASNNNGPARDQNHIDNGHVNRQNSPDKSKYSKPNQAPKLEGRTMKTPDRVTTQKDGRIRYEKDYGRKIGTRGETSHRVIYDPKKDKIRTSFPQNVP